MSRISGKFQQLCGHSQARDEWKVSFFISSYEHCLRIQHRYSISQLQESMLFSLWGKKNTEKMFQIGISESRRTGLSPFTHTHKAILDDWDPSLCPMDLSSTDPGCQMPQDFIHLSVVSSHFRNFEDLKYNRFFLVGVFFPWRQLLIVYAYCYWKCITDFSKGFSLLRLAIFFFFLLKFSVIYFNLE